jgi:hypothetical protein
VACGAVARIVLPLMPTIRPNSSFAAPSEEAISAFAVDVLFHPLAGLRLVLFRPLVNRELPEAARLAPRRKVVDSLS